MQSYVKRLENKIFKIILPKNRYLKWAWDNETISANWYTSVRQNPEHDLRRPVYKEFFESIKSNLSNSKSLGIDLGCGDFRITEYLLKECPGANFLGIDFSTISNISSSKIKKKYNNVDFINANVTNTSNWIPNVNARYGEYKTVIFTYGCLTYLSGKELKDLYLALHNIRNLECIISIEPIEKIYHDQIVTKKVESSFRHNYSVYLTEAGYDLKQYQFLFDSRDNVFMIAVPNTNHKGLNNG